MKRKLHLVVGIAFWVLAIGWIAAKANPSHESERAGRSALARYLTGPDLEVEYHDATRQLRRDDPIFLQLEDGSWQQVGHVSSTPLHDSSESTTTLGVVWYAPDTELGQCRLTMYRNSGRLEEVVSTMLPPEKRRLIQDRLAKVIAAHGEEMSAALMPLVRKSIQQSIPVIEEEFRESVKRHHDEIDRLSDRWNDQVVTKRLIPLARREILPIVQKRGQPIAEEIGRELWDRASIWRFGWRAVYDKTPLPEKNLVQGEWDRFVQNEAVPVFQSHMDEIVVAVQRVVTDVAANRVVRRELSEVTESVVSDPDARRLVRQVLKESLVDNQRLRDVWNEVWTSDEARRALNVASDRLEPVVRQIGDDLFGTPETGINPDFARVLRNQILAKDRRWIVARVASSPDQTTIYPAQDSMTYPIVYTADTIANGGDRP